MMIDRCSFDSVECEGVFLDQEICTRISDHVALQAKIHRVAKVHKQCPVIINVKDANFTPDIATGCKVLRRSMTIMDSIRNGVRSYFMRRTKPEQMSSSPRLSLLSVT